LQVSGRAGSALVFDSSLWHAGGANTTDAARRGVTLVYSRAFVKQQIDLPRATDPAIVAQASPLLRRLLGFDVRVPSSLEEFMLPEEQRLFKGGQG
jgi:ectoine hydroxylase-related dioxygenase (phytanoyl-CoA dioxygenase family)